MGHTAAQLAQMGKALVPDRDPLIAGRQRVRLGHRLGVFVEHGEPTLRRELLQDRARVATATEGGIDIVSVGVDGEGLNSFGQQDGLVAPWVLHGAPSEREAFEHIGHLALHGLCLFGVVSRLVPELEIAAHAQQHHLFGDANRFAQLG